MTKEELAKQYQARAEAEYAAGGSVDINLVVGSVSVTLSGGESYFFQGDEADGLLEEAALMADDLEIDEDDYIMAAAQNW